jgi:hypothetical protein
MTEEARSFEKFEPEDLAMLAAIAQQDLQSFIERNPHHSTLSERLILVALCQGAAMHYVDGRNGVKDFDVWSFFADDGFSPAYPPRRRGTGLYQGPRFSDSTRRVDLLGHTLPKPVDADPVAAVTSYLRDPKTESAWQLSRKAVVVISPAHLSGKVLWPAPHASA